MTISNKILIRFQSKIIKSDENSCWEWKDGKDKDGYGRLIVNGKYKKAHRLAYEIANGSIDNSKLICHSCDNPACVNPKHLWQGTVFDNNRDREAKGRGNPPIGERAHNAKLTESEVIEIRAIFSQGTTSQTELGKRFGVKHEAIFKIVRGYTWKHLLPVT